MFANLRAQLQNAAGDLWHELTENVGPGAESVELTRNRWPQFQALIEFDNRRLADSLLPGYRKMVSLFRDKLWLADIDTRHYYPVLVEYLDIWERWVDNSLPPELVERTGHTEARLRPFYKHIQAHYEELRAAVASGDPDISNAGVPMNIPENVKINLSQNLWGLLLSFVALGASENFHLTFLFWLALVASVVMVISVTATTVAYTFRYCRTKFG
jgi:hypothetical protein